jgi:hypothetical protein
MNYVVVIEKKRQSTTVGPYRNRKTADADAKAWSANGYTTWVEPVLSPAEYTQGRAAFTPKAPS